MRLTQQLIFTTTANKESQINMHCSGIGIFSGNCFNTKSGIGMGDKG